MGKLIDSAKKHSHAKMPFKMGDDEHELLVKLFNNDEYNEQLEIFKSGDNEKAAKTLAGYFLDSATLDPVITAEELLSEDWKNADTARLFDIFINANNGLSGN